MPTCHPAEVKRHETQKRHRSARLFSCISCIKLSCGLCKESMVVCLFVYFGGGLGYFFYFCKMTLGSVSQCPYIGPPSSEPFQSLTCNQAYSMLAPLFLAGFSSTVLSQ